MRPVPWRHVKSWNCITCGMCCRGYRVVLRIDEWVNLVRNYGVGVTISGINKFYLAKNGDGTCVFLYNLFHSWFCGLQHMKPIACKLWPFKILPTPKFGRSKEAMYKYRDKTLFLYVDPSCRGIKWGRPTKQFTDKTITELVGIILGLHKKQYYSTSSLIFHPRHLTVIKP